MSDAAVRQRGDDTGHNPGDSCTQRRWSAKAGERLLFRASLLVAAVATAAPTSQQQEDSRRWNFLFHDATPESVVAAGVADEGSWPAAAILGMGKCGTNALGQALLQIGLKEPEPAESWAAAEEVLRQGFSGEVNWKCPDFSTAEGLAQYKRHFSPAASNWLDKSTSEFVCSEQMGAQLPRSVRYFMMMCDPIRSVWSRMNHVRADGSDKSNPAEVMYAIAKRLTNSTTNCYELAKDDPRLNAQLPVCYQFEASMLYPDVIRKWTSAVGADRIKFMISEIGKVEPEYLVREAAAHMGHPVRTHRHHGKHAHHAAFNLTVGSVHTHEGEANSLETSGPEWDAFYNLVAPTLKPVCEQIRDEWPTLFGHGDARQVSKYWPCLWKGSSWAYHAGGE